MDFNEKINEMSWKKLVSIFGSVVLASWFLGGVVFLTAAYAIWHEYRSIVKEVDNGLAETKREMDVSHQEMKEGMKNFDKLVENQQNRTSEFFKSFDEEKEKHEKELNQSFENAEKERMAQHEENHSKI